METIKNTINYTYEAYSLLNRHCNGESYKNLKENMMKKYKSKSAYLEQLFDQINSISEDVLGNLNTPKDLIQKYFGALTIHHLCLANFIMLQDSYIFYDTPEEAFHYLMSITDQERLKEIIQCLNYQDDIYEITNKDSISTNDLFHALEQSSLTPEECWSIQQVYFNKETHLEELKSILLNVTVRLKEHEGTLQKLIDKFVHDWKNNNGHSNIYDILSQVGLNTGQKSDGYVLVPSVMSINSISVILHQDSPKLKEDHFITGILFGPDFSIAQAEEDYSNVLPLLKLLSDKSKFDILVNLKDKRAYGAELAKQMSLTTATISHHMSTLLDERLIKAERENTRLYYSLNHERIRELIDQLNELLG